MDNVNEMSLVDFVEYKDVLKLQKGNVVLLNPTVSDPSYNNSLEQAKQSVTDWEEHAKRICSVLQKLGETLEVQVPLYELDFTKELLMVSYKANKPHTIKSLYEALKSESQHKTAYTQSILKLML